MTSNSGYASDGSSQAPRLSVYLNLDNLLDLRADSAWPDLEGLARYEKLLADGFEGVQPALRRRKSNGTPETIMQSLEELQQQAGARWIVGAGCEVVRDTPHDNLYAMAKFVQTHNAENAVG
jgi:hypothetical protein